MPVRFPGCQLIELVPLAVKVTDVPEQINVELAVVFKLKAGAARMLSVCVALQPVVLEEPVTVRMLLVGPAVTINADPVEDAGLQV